MSKRKFKNPCGGKNPAEEWESAKLNSLVYTEYYNRLKEIAVNVFEWTNLPKEIDPRFLELTLFDTGMAVFFRDEIVEQYVALTTMIGGPLDIYRIPKYRRAYATNGYQRTLSDNDSVLIFNNYLHTPSVNQAMIFARRLYEIERTIDVNVKGQKFPILIQSDEKQRLTMKNLYMQYNGNEPFIFGDNQLNFQGIQAINTNSPFVSDKLQILKHQVWNEALTYFGVENTDSDKRERMVTDEAANSMGAVRAQRYVRLNARRNACAKINEMFGLNIWVDYRSDFSGDGDTDTTNVSRETNEEVSKDE